MSTDTIKARVARGAALLDEKLPGWVDRIDLDRLDLGSPCRCILGQTWDEGVDNEEAPYFLHVVRLFGSLGHYEDEIDHGFNASGGGTPAFNRLTAEWRRVILARRGLRTGGSVSDTRKLHAASALAGYVGSVVAANVLTSRYGRWPVAPGLATTAGTYAAGIALLARDAVQETAGRRAVVVAIVVGAALSAWLAGTHLAVASGIAFLLAESIDMAVYTPLRRRGWARAVLASNAAGAVLDTTIFLWLAGFPLTTATVTGQLIGKICWATAVPLLAVLAFREVRRRALLRHPVQP